MTTIVEFPAATSKLADLRKAYQKECERYDRAEYEGKHPRFNRRIKDDYFAARRVIGKLNNAIQTELVAARDPRVECCKEVADFPTDLPLNQ